MRVLFTLILLAGGAAAHAESLPARSPALRLLGISFNGNRAIPTSELVGALPIRTGHLVPVAVINGELQAPFVEAAFVEPLSRLYVERGYVDHRLTRDSVRLVRRKEGVLVRVEIGEGQRYQLGKLRLEGAARKHVKAFGIRPGQPFDGSKLARGIGRLARTFHDRGHAGAEVTPKITVDRERRTVDVLLQVDRGDVFAVEAIQLRGNLRIRNRIIRSALTFAVGDRYSESALERSWKRLMATGYFETVKLSLSRGKSGNSLIVTIDAAELDGCPRVDAT